MWFHAHIVEYICQLPGVDATVIGHVALATLVDVEVTNLKKTSKIGKVQKTSNKIFSCPLTLSYFSCHLKRIVWETATCGVSVVWTYIKI